MSKINNLSLDNNIAFQADLGNSYQINDSAREIISLLQQQKTKQQIAKELSKIYNTPENELYIDICDFVSKLQVYGLI